MKARLAKLTASILAIAMLFAMPGAALAVDIAFDAAADGQNNDINGVSFDVGNNPNRLLIVSQGFVDTSCSTAELSYGGVAMTRQGTAVAAGAYTIVNFTLMAPATGSNSFALTEGDCGGTNFGYAISSYYNVNGVNAVAGNNGNSSTGSITVNVAVANSWVVMHGMHGNGSWTSAGSNYTHRGSALPRQHANGDSNGAVGTGNYTMTINTSGSQVWNARGVAFDPVLIVNPTVTAVSVTKATNNDYYNIGTITGTGFASGATVTLTKGGQSDITCTSVAYTNSTTLTGGRCPIRGAATGTWSVKVTNSDTGNGSGSNLLTVVEGRGVNITMGMGL